MNGPRPENLRGELALDQIRAVQASTWPGLQGDIERGRVREVRDVEVVPIEETLTTEAAAYGVRVSAAVPPAPVAPGLIALAGRYHAWVLPTCGVAVALEPLEDEAVYLREHRRHVLALQDADEDDLVPLHEALAARGLLQRLLQPSVIEGTLDWKSWKNVVKIGGRTVQFVPRLVLARLVIGVRYRTRPTRSLRRVIEPIAPEVPGSTGPYR